MVIAYEELIDFIAAGTTPQGIIDFQPSAETRARVFELLDLRKTCGLSPEQEGELNQYLQLEHMMRLAKARARQHLHE